MSKYEAIQPDERFLRLLGRHVVSLSGTMVRLDENGKETGNPHFFACSGFVVSLREVWLLVTAGHILKRLEVGLRNKEIALKTCGLADYFGSEAKVFYSTP